MKIVKGDIWSYHPESYICVTTCGVCKATGALVMGKGIALQAITRFPGIEFTLGDWVRGHGNHVCLIKKHKLFSFPTKWHWKDDSDIELVERSAKEVVNLCDINEIKSIVLVPPGCGNGNLKWPDVKKVIGPILDNRFTVVMYE